MGRGGGNDGGVVATKRYLIKTRKEPHGGAKAAAEANTARWTTCALTGERLADPVVADELGNLFNKEAVLTYVLEGRALPAFAHIRSIKKDIIPLKLTHAQAHSHAQAHGAAGKAPAGAAGADSDATETAAVFMCPITRVEGNGTHAFVALRRCGCVVSERALATLKAGAAAASASSASVRGNGSVDGGVRGSCAASSDKAEANAEACPMCGTAYSGADVIKLCPSPEEADAARERMAARRAEKKAAHAVAAAAAAVGSNGPSACAASSSAGGATELSSRTNNHSSASLAAAAHDSGSGASIGNKRPRADMESGDSAAQSAGAAAAPAPARARTEIAGGASLGARAGHVTHHKPLHLARSALRPHEEICEASSAAASTAAEVERAIAEQKSKSAVFAKLFSSSAAPAGGGAGANGKGASGNSANLFIRTSTNVFTQSREY